MPKRAILTPDLLPGDRLVTTPGPWVVEAIVGEFVDGEPLLVRLVGSAEPTPFAPDVAWLVERDEPAAGDSTPGE